MSKKRLLTDRVSALPALAEAFRIHGYERASLSMLSKTTGPSKSSLHHIFPREKEDMMEAVIDRIDQWFVKPVFPPLSQPDDPVTVITTIMENVTTYFQSREKVCLVGWSGLSVSCDVFVNLV